MSDATVLPNITNMSHSASASVRVPELCADWETLDEMIQSSCDRARDARTARDNAEEKLKQKMRDDAVHKSHYERLMHEEDLFQRGAMLLRQKIQTELNLLSPSLNKQA